MSGTETENPVGTEIATSAISKGALVAVTESLSIENPEVRKAVDQLKGQITVGDVSSIIGFGGKAQEELTGISEKMIENVRNKDIGGAVSKELNDMVLSIRGFSLKDLQNGEDPGWFTKTFFKAVGPVARAIQRYESLESQIDTIVANLEKNITVLMKDIAMFDRMFDSAVGAFDLTKLHIQAAEEVLADIDDNLIPETQKRADSGDEKATQELMDLQNFRQRVERKINTLKKTRMITFTSLPRIRTLQDANVNAIEQTQETIKTAVPAWKQQFAILVAARRTQRSADDLKNAADFTNSVITETAQATKDATLAVQEQMERGIFDLEAIEASKNAMIETLTERKRIYDEAAARRQEENAKLEEFEAELKQAMEDASQVAA